MNDPIQLLNAYFDGKELSEAEERVLAEWARQSPENTKTIVELACVHSHVHYLHLVPAHYDELDELEESLIPLRGEFAPSPTEHDQENPGPWWRRAQLAAPMVAAACLLLGFVALFENSRSPADGEVADQVGANASAIAEAPAVDTFGPMVATVTESLDVVAGGRDLHTGAYVRVDEPIAIELGVLALTTVDGSRIVVEGPASLSFDDSKHIRLDSGRLTARINEDATGLVVVTPTAKVVDLGTEFGVAVGPEFETKLAVYEGAAELYGSATAQGEAPVSRRIEAGRAGYVESHGNLRWAVQTLPSDREFIRPDEIESLRRAHRGSAEAEQEVRYYDMLRVPGLLAYQSFDTPSGGAKYSFSFSDAKPRSDDTPVFEGNLTDDHLYSSGALRVNEGQGVFLDLDTSSDSPLAKANVLTERGHVGRSGSEVWLAWKTKMTDPTRAGNHAGLSLMFGDQRIVQEPLLFGYNSGGSSLSATTYIGSRIQPRDLDSDPSTFAVDRFPLDDSVRRWVVQIIFGERADKIALWCDVPLGEVHETRPNMEGFSGNVFFDRVQLRVSRDSSAWVYDDFIMATSIGALEEAEALLAREIVRAD